MTTRPTLPPPPPITQLFAATLAVLITLGIAGSIDELFQRAGRPFDPAVAAERVCACRADASERDPCLRRCASASPREGARRDGAAT